MHYGVRLLGLNSYFDLRQLCKLVTQLLLVSLPNAGNNGTYLLLLLGGLTKVTSMKYLKLGPLKCFNYYHSELVLIHSPHIPSPPSDQLGKLGGLYSSGPCICHMQMLKECSLKSTDLPSTTPSITPDPLAGWIRFNFIKSIRTRELRFDQTCPTSIYC